MWKKFTYPSGKQSSEGYFKNNKPFGYWTNFYETGEINSYGKWNEKGLDSVWLFFAPNGQIMRSISYAENLKNGEYIVYDSTQHISFQGFYVNDTLQGPFSRYANGKLVEQGNYQKGVLNGTIEQYDTLTGEIITILKFENGEEKEERRINQLINGKKEGLWEIRDAKGRIIRQEIYKNGELLKDDSDSTVNFVFEEEFYPNGQLKTQYATKGGLKNGIQSNFDENGKALRSEIYRLDTLQAKGWFDKEGLRDSLWEMFYPSGALYGKGQYKSGKKEGLWYYYFEDQKIEQKGRYFEDLPTGEWTWYYPNGQTRRLENYYKGRHEGEILDFDSTGTLIQKQTIAYDSREGDYYYFIGDHQEKGRFQNGLREGKWVYTYRNGKKAFVGKFKNGLAQGKHKIWYDTGRIAYRIHYKQGKIHGKKLEYYPTGGLMHLYIYKRGKIFSVDGIELKPELIEP